MTRLFAVTVPSEYKVCFQVKLSCSGGGLCCHRGGSAVSPMGSELKIGSASATGVLLYQTKIVRNRYVLSLLTHWAQRVFQDWRRACCVAISQPLTLLFRQVLVLISRRTGLFIFLVVNRSADHRWSCYNFPIILYKFKDEGDNQVPRVRVISSENSSRLHGALSRLWLIFYPWGVESKRSS